MATTDKLPFYINADDPPAKRKILATALRLFSERGLAATSIRDIANLTGFTNPALYKHFPGKEEMALHLFEVCHQYIWRQCFNALGSCSGFNMKLNAYIGKWLELIDEYPDVLAFLSDSARILWPRSNHAVHRKTMIGLAQSLFMESRKKGKYSCDPKLAAACLQGTLAELARMIQVGAAKGPAIVWKKKLVNLFYRLG